MMTPRTTIHLDPETARALAESAAALGLTVEEYLRKQFVGGNGAPAVGDVDRWHDELADGLDLPQLPTDFSAKDIYTDHN